ncbi:hypothetical protein NST99_01235 [Paenibacillus sp. FSL L8-0470]|uniref:hypothetical protein n=1 Tax=Paenibacillus sp. FSL L8-0470 TaxID=2954688 RepID=UPI0030FA6F1D
MRVRRMRDASAQDADARMRARGMRVRGMRDASARDADARMRTRGMRELRKMRGLTY